MNSMTKKGRGFKLSVLILMLSMVLSACGGGGSKTADAGDTGTKAAGETPKESTSDKKSTELVLYFAGDPQKDTELVEQKVNEYLQPKLNATVKINFVPWSDYKTKLPVLIASGRKIDVMFTNPDTYSSLAAKGALTPVNDLLDQFGADAKQAMYSKFLDISMVNGKNYAVQNPKEIASQWVLRFNKPLADKLGIDTTQADSIEKVGDLLKQAKAKDGGLYPMEATQTGIFYVPFDYVAGQDVPLGMIYGPGADSGKIVDMWETPQASKALDVVHSYYKAGYIRPDVVTYKMPTSEEQTGNWLTGLAGGIPTADNIWTSRAGFPVTYVPIEKPIVTTSSGTGSMLAIPVTAQDKELSMKFINLLHSDVYLHNLFVYGIEDVHYKKIGDNRVEDLPARKERFNTAWFEFGNGFLTYLTKDDPEDKWDQFKKFNDEAETSPLVGFNFDVSKVQSEIAAVKNVSAEISIPLKSGAVDPAVYLPKAISKFKEAGLDKIMTEMQSQYDAWKATK